jgi:hypothetical protein
LSQYSHKPAQKGIPIVIAQTGFYNYSLGLLKGVFAVTKQLKGEATQLPTVLSYSERLKAIMVQSSRRKKQ